MYKVEALKNFMHNDSMIIINGRINMVQDQLNDYDKKINNHVEKYKEKLRDVVDVTIDEALTNKMK